MSLTQLVNSLQKESLDNITKPAVCFSELKNISSSFISFLVVRRGKYDKVYGSNNDSLKIDLEGAERLKGPIIIDGN